MKQRTKKMLKILSIILIILTLFQFIFGAVPSFALSMEMEISQDTIRDIFASMDEEDFKKLIEDADEKALKNLINIMDEEMLLENFSLLKDSLGEDTLKELLGEYKFNSINEKQQVDESSLEIAKEIQEIFEDPNVSLQDKIIKLSQKIKEIAPEDADMDKVSEIVNEILEIDVSDPESTQIIAQKIKKIQRIHSTSGNQTNPVDVVLGVIDGLVGIFLNLFNIIPILLGGIIQGIATSVASIGGRTDMAS